MSYIKDGFFVRDLLGLCGWATMCFGVWQFDPRAALVLGGGCFFVLAILAGLSIRSK